MTSIRRILLSAPGIALLFYTGCADLRDDLPQPVAPDFSAHPSGWAEPGSASFHGDAIRNAGWDMHPCQTCHGKGYAGGTSAVSCTTCHTGSAGPEDCTTCHGGSNNPAPPRDLNGNSSSSVRGVGAHQRHFVGGGPYSSSTTPCSGCHAVPGSVYESGHVDTPSPAEVALSAYLASADPTGVPGPPMYSGDAVRCSNVFCHGNFALSAANSDYPFVYADSIITGRNASPLWTGGSSEAACGTCHALPPTGHTPAQITECGDCHSGVMNSSGVIANKALHINGKINVYGTERPFF